MNTDSMTHHITGDLFQKMTAEHFLPSEKIVSISFPWWEQQNSKVTCGLCWGQGTQNSSWMSSSYWADTEARRGVIRAPQNTILAPRQPLCMCFIGVKTSQKSYLILLCQPFIILSWLYSKQSNNRSFMLKVTGKQTSSFDHLKRLQQNVSWKSSGDWENHKPIRIFRKHQLFSTGTFLWSLPFPFFASSNTNLFCIIKHNSIYMNSAYTSAAWACKVNFKGTSAVAVASVLSSFIAAN